MNPSCNFTYGSESERWLSSNTLPPYSQLDPQVPKPAFLRTIEAKLDELNPELRELSLQIHGLSYVFECYFLNTILGSVAHPELMWKEKCGNQRLLARSQTDVEYLGLRMIYSQISCLNTGSKSLGITWDSTQLGAQNSAMAVAEECLGSIPRWMHSLAWVMLVVIT